MLGSFADFKKEVAEQAFDNLEPGGYFESCDLMFPFECDDGTLAQDSALHRWGIDMAQASASIDRPLSVANRLRSWYEEVGFEDVQEQIFKIPVNSWPDDPRWKEIGRLWQENLLNGISGWTLQLYHKVLKRTAEETEVRIL